jgi:hypothetical protein
MARLQPGRRHATRASSLHTYNQRSGAPLRLVLVLLLVASGTCLGPSMAAWAEAVVHQYIERLERQQ